MNIDHRYNLMKKFLEEGPESVKVAAFILAIFLWMVLVGFGLAVLVNLEGTGLSVIGWPVFLSLIVLPLVIYLYLQWRQFRIKYSDRIINMMNGGRDEKPKANRR